MKSNRLKFILSLLVLMTFFLYACKEEDIDEIALSNILLSDTDIQLSIGEVQAIIVSGEPENASEMVTWSSADESIAEIQFNDLGLVAGVQGRSLGTTTLTATTSNGSISKTVQVEVIVKVESIVLEEEPISDNSSQTRYNVVFTPADATYQTVTWSSSDPDVATVSDGLVIAAGVGATIITATTDQGEKTAFVNIIASGNPPILGLQYCSVSGTGAYNADTISTTSADINLAHAASQPANNYGYYENEVLVVQPGASFDLSLVHSNDWSMSLIYIDWNGDKDFIDEGELVGQFGLPSQSNEGPFNTNIAVPLDAAVGKIRMRVLTGDAWTTDIAGVPCGEYANSTTKDFDIEIGGVVYCDVSGTGGYNAESVITTNGDTNINHAEGQPSSNYAFYADQRLTVVPGNSFDLQIEQSNNWSMTIVWIDWNADGDFEDTDEQIQIFGLQEQSNDGPFSASISAPSSANKGTTRMRVLTGDAWTTNPALEPCGEYANSTTKDFIVEVK